MPRISAFFGMIVLMYWKEHNPPHVHVEYNTQEAVFEISPPRLIAGDLPNKRKKIVLAWITTHQDELLANWQKAQNAEPLAWINP